MRIGTMYLGTCDQILGESIQTKFLVIGLPLFPLSSHYVVSELGPTPTGYQIPLHAKSIGLAYLRVVSWLAAFFAGFYYYVDTRRHGDLLPWAIALIVIAVGSTFWLGKLPKSERMLRVIMKAVAGTAAPPELLPVAIRERTIEQLLAVWREDHGERPWDRAIEDDVNEMMLVVIAAYHLRPDLAARALDTYLTKRGGDTTAAPYR